MGTRRAVLVGMGGLSLIASAPVMASGRDEQSLGQAVRALPRASAIHVAGRGTRTPYGAASGRGMSVETPVRIASNTKPFTAAAALRLWEMGRLDLEAPIASLLSPELTDHLRRGGYDPDRISPRQLMSHSAGLYDHGGDPRFIQAILADPARVWTREDLVALCVGYSPPPHQPGQTYLYSDTGYILLGDIIEREMGRALGPAVRELLGMDRLGLSETWWEVMEPRPEGAPDRAPQALGPVDAGAVHASMDLYGGGGLVMSARDLAVLFAALFEGQIFDRPETLQQMLRPGPHRRGDHYRLGVFVSPGRGGGDIYWHTGFWGTVTAYAPDEGVCVAGATLNQDGAAAMRQVVEDLLDAEPLRP